MKTSFGRSRMLIDSFEATQAGRAGSRQLTFCAAASSNIADYFNRERNALIDVNSTARL
jgi:hypothetical protein